MLGTVPLTDVLGAGYSLQNYQLTFQRGQRDNDTACTNITLSNDGVTVHRKEFLVYLETSDSSVILDPPFIATVVVTDQDSECIITWIVFKV